MKSKKIFTSWLYGIMIFQMIVLPVAPVMAAEEITPSSINIVANDETPVVQNITVSNPGDSSSGTITLTPTPTSEAGSTEGTVTALPVSGDSSQTATITLGEMTQPENVVVTQGEEAEVQVDIDKKEKPTGLEKKDNQLSQNEIAENDKKKGIIKNDPKLFEALNKPKEVSEDGLAYDVIDAYTDVAYKGNGEKVYRIYETPRMLYEDKGVLKVRGKGWNKFDETPKLQLNNDKNRGYGFSVPMGNDSEIGVNADNLEIGDKAYEPQIPKFGKLSEDSGATVSKFENVYDGIDFIFKDIDAYRSKEIYINVPPKNLKIDQPLIFWETYALPAGAKVYDEMHNLVEGKSEQTQGYLTIEVDERNKLLVTNAGVYDGSAMDPDLRELNSLVKPLTQVNIVDYEKGTLRVGIKLNADYLLAENRVYPVVIDPLYYTCPEVLPGGTDLGCNLTELYLRYKIGNSIADGQPSDALYVGSATDGSGLPLTRHIVLRYNFSLPANENVTVARLYMHSASGRTGLGTDTGVDVTVKKIGTSWAYATPSTLTYTAIKDNLTVSSMDIVTAPKTGDGTWKQWEVTNLVQFWKNNPAQNYGLVVEPSAYWDYAFTLPQNWRRATSIFDSRAAANTYGPYLSISTQAIQYPDLTRNGVNLPTSTFKQGDEIFLSFGVHNAGAVATPGGEQLRYYLNKDNLSYSLNPLTEETLGSIGAGVIQNHSLRYTIPANLTPGTYYLSYYIDANNTTNEGGNENNNQFYHVITINANQPDLTYQNDSVSTTSVLPGNSVTLTTTVKNNSSANSSAGYVYYYFKKDSVSYTDAYKVDYDTYSAMAPGGTSGESMTYTIPAGTVPGTYALYYWVDALNDTAESDENNNKKSFTITVNGTQDLQPTNASITNPTAHLTGDSITIRALINNYGNKTASSVPYTLRLKKTDTNDYFYLTNLSPVIPSIAAGSSTWVDFTGTIPADMPYTGLYYASVFLDPLNTITESDEMNNSILTGTAIPVTKRDIGGGGSYTNYDGDSGSDVAEVVGGTNPTGAQTTAELYDIVKYKLVKSMPTDVKVAGSLVTDLYDNGLKLMSMKNTTPNVGGDPVNLRNGALEFETTDFVLPAGAGMPIKFTRTYNSKLFDWNSRFGNGWTHSYDLFYFQDATTKDVQVYLGGSLATVFTCPTTNCTPTAGGSLVPAKGTLEKMIKENGYFVYQTMDGRKYVFSKQVDTQMYMAGSIVDTNGNTVTLDYTNIRQVPLLSKISVSPTRYIYFTYPADSNSVLWDKIQTARSSIGGEDKLVATYTYNANKQLTGVHQESSYLTETVKNIDRTLEYDATGKLLTYSDPRGTVLYNEYDPDGKVVKQYEKNPRIGSTDKREIYWFQYLGADADAPGSSHCTLLTTKRDASVTYTQKMCFNSDGLKIYEKNGDDVLRWSYDANGMIATATDARGNVTSYSYDADRRLIGEIPADINGNHTVITQEYWNNPSRLKKRTETVTNGGQTIVTRDTTITVAQDGKGNISSTTDAMGATESFTYNANGTVNTYTNKLGQVVSYGYDSNGYRTSETTSVVQADNTTQTVAKQYVYDNYGRLTSSTDPNGNVYTYAYDSRGNLRQENKPGSVVKTYEYDVEDHKIKETDEEGRVTNYVFDTDINASLLSVTKETKLNPGAENNLVFARQYDYVGNLMKEIDPMGRETTYTYDSANRVVSKVDPQKTSTYEYYAGGLLKKETNSAGQRADYIYDARGNRTEVRNFIDDANYISTKYEYDGLNRTVKTIDGKNNFTTFVYDKLDRITSKTAADGGITEYFYDNAGNKVGERGPRAQADASLRNANGHSVTLVYNGLNQLIKAVNADDKVTLNFYDANGNPIKTIDRQEVNGTQNTRQTQFEYYANNLKKKEIYADGGVVEYTYDNVGNLKTKKDQLNRTWTYNYDDFNRLVEELDPANNSTKNTFDKDGNKLSVTYPDNTKTEFFYNSANMLVSVKDANGGETVFTYDAAGNKLTETDKRNLTTTFAYDKLNRLISETNPQTTVSSYVYDDNGNRVSETVGGLTTAYEFDSMNRLTKITYPGAKTESWTYDKDGNRLTFVNGNAQTITYAYDKLDRLTTKHLPDGSGFDVVYVYDNWSNLTRLIDQSGTTDYVYDAMNRNTSETKAINGLSSGKTIQRTYKLSGQLASITDAANREISYNYNNRAMLSSVRMGLILLAGYQYNSFGKPSVVTYGNEVVTTHTYDSLNRTSAIETKNGSTLLFKQEYQYDAESNRTRMIETRVDEAGNELQATVNYTYDSLGQLTLVDNPEESGAPSNDFAYAYDARGNRTTGTTPADGATYTYTDGTNELSEVSYNNGLMTVASVYDGAGSLLKETFSRLGIANKEVNYAWGSEGTLASISYKNLNRPSFMPEFADNTIAFVYDDFGNRVKKSANGSAGSYYLNDGLTVLDELDADGNVEKTMVKGVGPVAEIGKDGTIQYVHTDALGSAVLLTNGEGKVAHQYEYEAFGRMASDIGSASDETNYTFTNQEFDPESGLYYYNARYYNPRLGRFISRDTVLGNDGDTLSRNLYIYVKNNPFKYTDPTGNFSAGLLWEGTKDLFWGGLSTAVGVGQIAAGVGLAVGGTAATAGIGAVPAVAGGVVVAGFGANNYVSGFTQTAGGLVNIWNSVFDDKADAVDYTYNPAHEFINNNVSDPTLKAGAHIAYAIGDISAGGVSSGARAVNELKNLKGIGATGAFGEDALKALGGVSQVRVETSLGVRVIDQVTEQVPKTLKEIANESKVGYQTLTSAAAKQIAKDKEIVQSGKYAEYVYNFFRSPVTGKIGPSGPYADAITDAGLGMKIHDGYTGASSVNQIHTILTGIWGGGQLYNQLNK